MNTAIATTCVSLVLCAGGTFIVRASGGPPQAPTQTERCADLVKQLNAVKQEIDDINQNRPPWNAKTAEEIRTNFNYRLDEIHNLETRRSSAGCPGAQPLMPPAAGASTPVKPGTLSADAFINRFVALCLTLPKSEHSRQSCHFELDEDNWGDLSIDEAVRETEEHLAKSDLTERLNINGTPGTAGKGVDVGTIAMIVWKRDGHTFLSSFEHSDRRDDADRPNPWEYARDEAVRYARRLDNALK